MIQGSEPLPSRVLPPCVAKRSYRIPRHTLSVRTSFVCPHFLLTRSLTQTVSYILPNLPSPSSTLCDSSNAFRHLTCANTRTCRHNPQQPWNSLRAQVSASTSLHSCWLPSASPTTTLRPPSPWSWETSRPLRASLKGPIAPNLRAYPIRSFPPLTHTLTHSDRLLHPPEPAKSLPHHLRRLEHVPTRPNTSEYANVPPTTLGGGTRQVSDWTTTKTKGSEYESAEKHGKHRERMKQTTNE